MASRKLHENMITPSYMFAFTFSNFLFIKTIFAIRHLRKLSWLYNFMRTVDVLRQGLATYGLLNKSIPTADKTIRPVVFFFLETLTKLKKMNV